MLLTMTGSTALASQTAYVDRHVLSTNDWKADPSILYAGPKKVYTTPVQEITKVVRVDVEEAKDEVITKTQFCDENDNCGEWREQK